MTAAARGGWGPAIVAAAAVFVVAGAGGLATDIGPWYRSLRLPSWQPPDWAFGPAWTIIFALTAIAGLTAWRATPDAAARRWLLVAFAVNGALNVLWSVLFFKMRRPDWAFWEVGALWLSIAVLVLLARRSSRRAAWLLVPYLAWVTFAATLNLEVVRLNAPFQTAGPAGG